MRFIFSLTILLILWGCQRIPSHYQQILIKGSDTEVNLALTLAETFMASDPGVSIAVTGGGSGTGIAALINGKTDIANSSRPMKLEELAMAKGRNIHPTPIIVGVDALALVVNETLSVDSLSLDEVSAIFRGEISNWKQLGGEDLPISLYGRQSNSGTYTFFREQVLQAEYAPQLKQMNGTAQIVEGLRNDPAGIGYVGAGYILKKTGEVIGGVKILKIKSDDSSPAVSPTDQELVNAGAYPIVRPLFQYLNGLPSGKLRQFVEFCLSEKGQQIVAKNGYYPIFQTHRQQNNLILTRDHDLSRRD